MFHAAAVSIEDLTVNALFAVFGACLSVGLAVWLDVSGATERLRARRARAAPADDFSAPVLEAASQRPAERRARMLMKPAWGGAAPKRWIVERLTDLWLLLLELRTLLIGCGLTYGSIWAQPVIDELRLPGPATVVLGLTPFMAGLFLISWTWASGMRARLAARVVFAFLLPLALFGSVYLSLVTNSEFLSIVGKVLAWAIAGLPIASLLVRVAPSRSLRPSASGAAGRANRVESPRGR